MPWKKSAKTEKRKGGEENSQVFETSKCRRRGGEGETGEGCPILRKEEGIHLSEEFGGIKYPYSRAHPSASPYESPLCESSSESSGNPSERRRPQSERQSEPSVAIKNPAAAAGNPFIPRACDRTKSGCLHRRIPSTYPALCLRNAGCISTWDLEAETLPGGGNVTTDIQGLAIS